MEQPKKKTKKKTNTKNSDKGKILKPEEKNEHREKIKIIPDFLETI